MIKALFLLSTTTPDHIFNCPCECVSICHPFWAFLIVIHIVWMMIVVFSWTLNFMLLYEFCLAVKSREYSHFNVSWIQVGEKFVYVLVWLVEVWLRIKENKEKERKKSKRKKKKKIWERRKRKRKKNIERVLKKNKKSLNNSVLISMCVWWEILEIDEVCWNFGA